MSMDSENLNRRKLLQTVAGLALSQAALVSTEGIAATGAGSAPIFNPPGKPGDFNFLSGEWRISHRRFKPETKTWDEFKGKATCWTILGGVGSVEELRIPARDFSGMGLRLLDMKDKVWRDFWVNGKFGILTPPGMPGHFVNGDGIFEADDMDGDKPIKVRGIWDRITPRSCRWYQAVSRDKGKTWEENWFMDWVRA
jgi:hypothetical protein